MLPQRFTLGVTYCAENRIWNGRSLAETFFPRLRLKISGELS